MLLDLLHRFVRRRFQSLGFQSRFLESDVGRLHYLLLDHPQPASTLILVHGLGTSSSTWLKVLPLIKGNHRIVALDLPGFGFSTVKGVHGFCALNEHVEALSVFLDCVAQKPFILLGHSFGGWVSALYTARHPQKIERLVLVSSVGVYYRGVEKLQELFTLNSVKDARRLLDNLWYRYPWYFKPFARSIWLELSQRHMNELVRSIDATHFLADELARLTMPVDIIWGREDKVTSPESVNVFRKFVPHAAAFFIDRCGHVPQLERPAEFASLVNHILEKKTHELA
jgi:abhydrolase domain-containing protein 6